MASETGTQNQSAGKTKSIYVTSAGLPLSFHLEWPFRKSTAGADFWYMHADIRLEGSDGLHAPVAVNLSATVREVMPSLEPKDLEAPVINALRKEVDKRQLEFVKSGKLVPVQFSSRHWNFQRNQWMFGKATDEAIAEMLERKIYWQSKLMGGDVPVAELVDAQYVESTPDHLAEIGAGLVKRGLIKLERRWATALDPLMAQAEKFEAARQAALTDLEKKHAFERG
jgi:hypothetical protein